MAESLQNRFLRQYYRKHIQPAILQNVNRQFGSTKHLTKCSATKRSTTKRSTTKGSYYFVPKARLTDDETEEEEEDKEEDKAEDKGNTRGDNHSQDSLPNRGPYGDARRNRDSSTPAVKENIVQRKKKQKVQPINDHQHAHPNTHPNAHPKRSPKCSTKRSTTKRSTTKRSTTKRSTTKHSYYFVPKARLTDDETEDEDEDE